MSGYLNLGISLLFVSDFQQCERAFLLGLQIAREKGNRRFEGEFINNIGNAYHRQGKLHMALKSYREALAITKEIANGVGQASALENIGLVYSSQGKLKEALKF